MDADTVAVSEVEVMLQVGDALSALPDVDARRRVVLWLMERYHIGGAPSALTDEVPAAVDPAADPCLAVDELADLFEAHTAAKDDLELPPAVVATPHATPADVPARQPGVESLIRGFADEFRRFALEWQGA